jgi:hypothetical protein
MHYLITSLSDDPRREYRSPQRMYRSPQRTPRYRSPTGSADSNQDEVVPPGVANSPTLVGPRRKLVCDDEPVHVLFSLKPYAPDTLCLSLCAQRVQRCHFFLEPEDLRRHACGSLSPLAPGKYEEALEMHTKSVFFFAPHNEHMTRCGVAPDAHRQGSQRRCP